MKLKDKGVGKMKYKECIKRVGIKNVILYELLHILEIIINSPYLLIRVIAVVYSNILELIIFICEKQQSLLAYLFKKQRIISLGKINKKIDEFRINTIKKLRS